MYWLTLAKSTNCMLGLYIFKTPWSVIRLNLHLILKAKQAIQIESFFFLCKAMMTILLFFLSWKSTLASYALKVIWHLDCLASLFDLWWAEVTQHVWVFQGELTESCKAGASGPAQACVISMQKDKSSMRTTWSKERLREKVIPQQFLRKGPHRQTETFLAG